MNQKNNRYYTFIRPILRNKIVRDYSGLLFSLFIVAVFSVFALKPTLAAILVRQQGLSEQQKVLSDLNQKEIDLARGKANLNSIDPQIRLKLENLLPSQTSIPELLNALNTLGTVANASVSGVQLQPVSLAGTPVNLSKNAKLQEITFSLNTTGTYEELTTLLNAFKKSSRLITINSISLNQGGTNLSMTINATAYFLQN